MLYDKINKHQDIQAMTWEIKEVIDTMTMMWKSKKEIAIETINVLKKHICEKCMLEYSNNCEICNWFTFTK